MFDDRRRRITVLDTAFAVVRTIPLTVPLLYSATVLPDGSPVLATYAATRAGAGFPLHLLDERGQIAASFGGDEEGFRPDLLDHWSRVVSSAGDGSVWATSQNDYVLEQWEPAGRMRRRIVRRPGWFDPLPRGAAAAPDRPPSSRVFDLQLDADGYLWTLTGVAARDWVEGVRKLSGTGWEIADPGRYYDTVIEVIDPISGELIAATRTSGFLYTFAGERLAVGQSLSDGAPRAHIRQLVLRGR